MKEDHPMARRDGTLARRLPRLGRLVATLLVGLAVVLAHPSVAGAQGAEDGGEARLVDAESSSSVSSGGSTTAFTIRLPDAASCPGDTGDGDYLVQTFMVPSNVNPGDVTYNGLGPTPEAFGDYPTFREALYDLHTAAFASKSTAKADEPGGPGR